MRSCNRYWVGILKKKTQNQSPHIITEHPIVKKHTGLSILHQNNGNFDFLPKNDHITISRRVLGRSTAKKFHSQSCHIITQLFMAKH